MHNSKWDSEIEMNFTNIDYQLSTFTCALNEAAQLSHFFLLLRHTGNYQTIITKINIIIIF